MDVDVKQREAFLMEQCPDDQDIRDRVSTMLRAYDSDDTFLESPLKNFGQRFATQHGHEALVGTQVGPYRIRRVIAQGGMGVVFEAFDTKLEKIVALKMMNPALMQDRSFKLRFEQEAKTLAKLEDPHFVRVHALMESNHNTFIVMEYINGITLAEHIRAKGKLTPREVARVGLQLLTALSKAHKQNIIHRDLKPSNIMLTRSDDGKLLVKVLDFGIAKNIKSSHAVTRTMGSVGTLYYMSPEQIRALPTIDHRTDIYSSGVTLYEALNGSLPLDITKDEFTIRKQIVEGRFHDASSPKRAPSNPVEQVLAKALQIAPTDRYQSADEMRAALLSAIRREHVDSAGQTAPQSGASQPVTPQPLPIAPKKKKNIAPLALAAIGILVLAPIILYAMTGSLPFLQPASSGTDSTLTVVSPPSVNPESNSSSIAFDTTDTDTPALPPEFQHTEQSDSLLLVSPSQDPLLVDTTIDTGSQLQEDLPLAENANTILEDATPIPETPDTSLSPVPTLQDSVVRQAPVQFGTITLLVRPPGNLFVNNNDFGPIVVEPLNLPADTHRFVIQNREYGTWECSLPVPANQSVEKNILFDQPISIPVVTMLPDSTTIRNASILMDGAPTGYETPQTIRVFPGLHTFEAQLSGYTQEEVLIDGAEGCFQKINTRVNFDSGIDYRDKRVIVILSKDE